MPDAAMSGPATVWVVDVDSILERWRARHPSSALVAEPREPADDPGVAHRRPARWWRRRVS